MSTTTVMSLKLPSDPHSTESDGRGLTADGAFDSADLSPRVPTVTPASAGRLENDASPCSCSTAHNTSLT